MSLQIVYVLFTDLFNFNPTHIGKMVMHKVARVVQQGMENQMDGPFPGGEGSEYNVEEFDLMLMEEVSPISNAITKLLFFI
jgi:hypothetical protein